MTESHKAALATGRQQGAAVRRYLEAVETHRPKRGRKRTVESIDKRLSQIDTTIATAGPVERLQMIQERLDLHAERERLAAGTPDLEALEDEFVSAAAEFSARRGISYSAWRELGVAPELLRRAGITRRSI